MTASGERVRALVRAPRASQADFRVLLDALARPGTVGRLDGVPGVPPALIPAAGLADVEVPLAVLDGPGGDGSGGVGAGPDRDGWAAALYAATGAPPASPETARMVVALRQITPEEIASLPRGDALAPELGARLVLAVRGLGTVDPAPRGGTTLELSGPGVPGTRRLAVAGVAPEVFEALARANAVFPAGIDTFLVAGDGGVAGLPRGARIALHGATATEVAATSVGVHEGEG